MAGLHGLLYDSDLIKDEYRGDFAKFIKTAANFFKHADTDPHAEIDFLPSQSELFILMSITGLSRMGKKLGMAEIAFNNWMIIHNPHWAKEGIIDRIPIEALDHVRQNSKADYFKIFKELWPVLGPRS